MSGFTVLVTASVATLALAGGAQASSHQTQASTYTSQPVTVVRNGSATQLPQGIQPDTAFLACSGLTDLPLAGGCGSPTENDGGDQGTGGAAPNVSTSLKTVQGTLLTNFNGTADADQVDVIGGHVTPPDQGLCIGPAGALEGAGVPLGVPGGKSVVVEMTNLVWSVYSTSGDLLYGPDYIGNLFNDPYASGDPECNYDQSTHTFFFTEIGSVDAAYYGTGVVVMNAGGYTAYYVDTSEGGACLPDFPHQGYDNNALYITINEFYCTGGGFTGVNIYALSKQQLASHNVDPNGVYWELSDSYYSFRPAIGNATNTEYLLASEQNDYTQNALDFAQVTGDSGIASGDGPVVLSVSSIDSESYTEPVDAQSTGDGSCTPRPGHSYCITSEKHLDPVDMRLEQVQYSKGQLYTSLSTALTVGDDPTVVDGAAWFQVDTKSASVVRQGYVGVAGTYLLMPSFVQSKSGAFMMGFSLTSPTLNPSTGYVVSTDLGQSFSDVTITGEGSGPHLSFSPDIYGRYRWGDYSMIAFDPVNSSVWMADEYIPPLDEGGSDTVDNWGTRVWQLTR